MTSNINPNTINVNYPVANSDNPSQGFRDNFEKIKANLQVAASEISALQNTTIRLGGPVQSKPVTLTSDPNGTLVVTSFQTSDLANSIVFPGSGAIQVPSGSIAQRPVGAPLPPNAGMMRFNTDLKAMEYYNGQRWVAMSPPPALQGPIIPTTSVNGPGIELLNAASLIYYNLPFIRAQTSAWVVANYPVGYTLTADQINKCQRDIGVIIGAVLDDVLTNIQANSVAAGNSYWTGTSSVLSYSSAQQKLLTVNALEYALGLIQKIISNISFTADYPTATLPGYTTPPTQVIVNTLTGGSLAYAAMSTNIKIVENIIQNGPTGQYANYIPLSPGNFSAQTLAWKNLPFIAAEVVAFVNANMPVGYTYDTAKCQRDTIIVVSCVMNDILAGINLNSILAGNSYWVGAVSVLPDSTHIGLTIDAFDYASTLLQKCISNTPVANPYQSTTTQITDVNYTQGYLWENDVANRFAIITNIIANGVLAQGLQTGPTGPSGGPIGPTGSHGPTGPSGGPPGPTGPLASATGPVGSIQYNNAGQFGGSSNLVYDGTQLVATQAQIGDIELTADSLTNILQTGVLNLRAQGQVNFVNVVTKGSGYVSVPSVTLDPPSINSGVQATASAEMGMVVATPYNRGVGYLPNDVVVATGGIGAAQTTMLIDTVRIKTATPDTNNRGVGYQPGDVLTVAGGEGPAPATIIVTKVRLQNPSIIAGGQGYVTGDTVEVFGGSDTPATGTITASPILINGQTQVFNIVGNTTTTLSLSFAVPDNKLRPGIQVYLLPSGQTQPQLVPLGSYTVQNIAGVATLTFSSNYLANGDTVYVGVDAFYSNGGLAYYLSETISVQDQYNLYVTVNNVPQTLNTHYTIQPITLNDGITSYTTSELVFASGVLRSDGTTSALQIGDKIKTVLGGVVTSLSLVNPGSYYVIPSILANPAVGGSGTGLIVEYETAVDTVQLQDQGPYYTIPTLTMNKPTGGSGFGAYFNLQTEINTLVITNPGNYTFLPELIENVLAYPTGITGTGSGATVNFSSGVVSITLNNPGSGYTQTPRVSIDASPTGNNAHANAQMTGAKVMIGDLVVNGTAKGTAPQVTNIIWVTQDGDDRNDGLAEDRAKRTIKAAAAIAEQYTTIFVRSGNYTEDNPIYLPPYASIIGDNLRRVNLFYKNPTEDFFWVSAGCYIAGVSFRGGQAPGYSISFPPLVDSRLPVGVSGAGNIVQSPYIQNCTCFNTTGGGMLVDGNRARGLKSMVLDAFTQFNQGGPGITVTNEGYAQLVSIFTICCDIGTLISNGGIISVNNSNTSFGRIGIQGDGVSPYKFGGTIQAGTGLAASNTLNIQNIESRPYVGIVGTVGPLFSYVQSVTVKDQGIGYKSQPDVVLDPPIGYARKQATAIANVANGGVISITLTNTQPGLPIAISGNGYTGSASVTIYDASGTGAIVNYIAFSAISATVLTAGRGYNIGDIITVQGGNFPSLIPPLPQATLQVTAIDSFGGVVSTTFFNDITNVQHTGRGYYTVLPQFSGAATTTNGTGTGFTCSLDFGISDIVMVQPGTGYTSPQVYISGAGGVTALGNVNYDSVNGTVTGVNIVGQGFGYISQPTVKISGGGIYNGVAYDTGATAVAEVTNGAVTNVRITNPGSNFVIDPEITFSGGYGASAKVGQIYYKAVTAQVNQYVTQQTSQLLVNGGSGYKVNDILTVIGGTGIPTQLLVTGVTANTSTSGIVASVSIWTPGSYSSMPPLNGASTTCTNPNGQGCLVDLSMGLDQITLASGGNSYTSGPRVRFVGGDAVSFAFQAGQGYYTNAALNIASTLVQPTLDAVAYIRDYSRNLVQNTTTAPSGYTGSPYQSAVLPQQDLAQTGGVNAIAGVSAFYDLVDYFVTNGSSLSAFDNAYLLLQLNKSFLQAEITAWVQANYPTLLTVAQLALCTRDVGLIVDAISVDASSGGIVRSIRAGQSYWNGTTSVIGSTEIAPTVAALTYLNTLMQDVVANTQISTASLYQQSVVQTVDTTKPNGSAASENIKACVDVLQYIIQNGITPVGYHSAANLLRDNAEFLKAEAIAYILHKISLNSYPNLVFDDVTQQQFGKQINTIINAVAGDLIGGGGTPAIAESVLYPSYYTVATASPLVNGNPLIIPVAQPALSLTRRSGQYYYSGNTLIIPSNTVAPTVNAINYALAWMENLIQNISTAPSGYAGSPYQTAVLPVTNSSYSGGVIASQAVTALVYNVTETIQPASGSTNPWGDAATLLQDNLVFLQNEIGAWVSDNYPGFLTSTQLTTCERDVGIIVNGMIADMLAGGFFNAIDSGRAYWNGVTSLIPGETTQTLGAMQRLKTVALEVIQNQTVTPSAGNTTPQTFDLAKTGGVQMVNLLSAAFDIIISIIDPTQGISMSSWFAASELIRLNKAFLQAEVAAYVTATYPTLLTASQLATCSRDVGFIVDSVAGDITGSGGHPLSHTSNNSTVVTLEEVTDYAPLDGENVNFYQVSLASVSSHQFEFVGAGTDINTCLPRLGGVPIQANEVVMTNGGRVYYTSTDHKGDFRIGPGLVINQNSGTLSGRVFEKSLFSIMTPFILSIEAGG